MPGNCDTLHQARAYRARDSYEIDAVVTTCIWVDILGGHSLRRFLRIVILPDNTWMLRLFDNEHSAYLQYEFKRGIQSWRNRCFETVASGFLAGSMQIVTHIVTVTTEVNKQLE